MAQPDLQAYLLKLHKNFNILAERAAKYGSNNASLELLNQIDDHKKSHRSD